MASNIYDILDKIINKVKTKSTVGMVQVLTSGTEIATITIDGTTKSLYTKLTEVSVAPKITSGEEIGTISVDATPTKLYHPTLTSVNKAGNTDNLVAQLTHGSSTVDIYADGITTTEETDLLNAIGALWS